MVLVCVLLFAGVWTGKYFGVCMYVFSCADVRVCMNVYRRLSLCVRVDVNRYASQGIFECAHLYTDGPSFQMRAPWWESQIQWSTYRPWSQLGPACSSEPLCVGCGCLTGVSYFKFGPLRYIWVSMTVSVSVRTDLSIYIHISTMPTTSVPTYLHTSFSTHAWVCTWVCKSAFTGVRLYICDLWLGDLTVPYT